MKLQNMHMIHLNKVMSSHIVLCYEGSGDSQVSKI